MAEKKKAASKATAGRAGKGRRAKRQLVLVNFLLDQSGSMGSVTAATISGYNEYLGDQKAQDADTLFTLTTFDTEARVSYLAVPAAEVPELTRETYRPGGLTALYDAVGTTVERTRDRIQAMDRKPDVVLFVIMTDGGENASKEYSASSLKPLITEGEASGWTFVFLGADQDSWAAASKFGLGQGNVLDYGKGKTGTTFTTLSAATTRLRDVACMASVSGDDKAYGEARKSFWNEDEKAAVKE